MTDLHNWVNDRLHDIIGFTDSSTVNYIVALGKQSKSTDQFVHSLIQFDLPDNDDTRAFAKTLLDKFPKGNTTSKLSTFKQQENVARQLARENESFKFVEMYDTDEKKSKSSKFEKLESLEKTEIKTEKSEKK